MERFILKKLLDWKNSPYRKPLILKGVRQVGKTWILKEFGRRCYENTAYFNFDENEEYKQFFETTKDVDRILQNLMLASGQKILPEKTLIIFDEVRECAPVPYRLCRLPVGDRPRKAIVLSSRQGQFHADRSHDFLGIPACKWG